MIQRYSVFSGTYDNAIDPRKDPEGDFCYWFDVEPLIAERDALAQFAEARRVQINELMDENAELKRTPRTTGECSGCLEMKRRLGVFTYGIPEPQTLKYSSGVLSDFASKIGITSMEDSMSVQTAKWLIRIASLNEVPHD